VGESGVIPIPAAIANAVRHALDSNAAELNVLPLTPETVLNAIGR
jgi:CO/xanthine dehydrogenase Mo-binding subunit